MAPLHITAPTGNLELYRNISTKLSCKNPLNCDGLIPLAIAARFGHLDIFKYIFEQVDDKNPTDFDKWTPLHHAARGGHMDICKYIIEKVENKNPIAHGMTPRDVASRCKMYQIVQLFDNLNNID